MTGSERPAVPEALLPELPALRALAIDLAQSAGRLVRAGRAETLATHGGVSVKSTRTDVVTAMDRACEEFLRERLATARPGDAVLGEEAGVAGTPGAVTWVVDPIDGTVNYLYGRPEYAVSVAAVIGDPCAPGAWTPVAGAVANPVLQEVYHAHLGGGAALRTPAGEVPLRVNDVRELALTLLATGFGYAADVRREQARALVGILPVVRDIRRGGSAALDLCAVASGVVDAYAERGVHPWDVAAGWIVAAEAGASVHAWDSGADRPLGLLAAPPMIAEPLHRLLLHAYGAARTEAGPDR